MAAIAEQAKLEESNIAGIGSAEDRALRKKAAESEPCFKGVGGVGLRIWRVENKRTEADTPDFGIADWPEAEYGTFYKGDSYLVLNGYKVEDKLLFDVHFWIGDESSIDEKGVAAYKAVELDDLLDDLPVQHREVMGHETGKFQSYFKKGMKYLEGGIASGFRHVKEEEYEPRLLQVKKTKRTVRAFQVACEAKSLNAGDVFVLDAGKVVTMWAGDSASPFEKAKGASVSHNIIAARLGKASKGEVGDDFWATLKGSEADVGPAVEHDAAAPEDVDDANNCLLRLSDADGAMKFEKVSDSPLKLTMLDSKDAFIVDAGIEIFAWIGRMASNEEKSHAMLYAQQYLDSREDRPAHTPITRIKDGQINSIFLSCFSS